MGIDELKNFPDAGGNLGFAAYYKAQIAYPAGGEIAVLIQPGLHPL